MKTKKLLSLLLALMMMLSVVPFYASAAEPITLTTSNIAIVPPSVSPGEMLYGDAWSTLTITGGELYYIAEDGTETLVPGHFEHYRADGMPAEGDNRAVPFNFVSEDTTKFTSIQRLQSGRVTVKSGTWPTINVVAGRVRPTITEAPTPVNAKPGMLWGEVTFTGGKAEYEGTNVDGTFVIEDSYSDLEVSYGSYGIKVRFVPTDTQTYLSLGNFNLTVTVKKPITFVDESGAEIVPEITVPYGTKFNDISRLLRPYVKAPEYVYFAMGDLSSQLCANGTYTVTATAPDDSEHYEDTDLTFKIVVEKKVINPKGYSSTEGYYVLDNSGVYNVEGTFDVYIDGKLYKSGVKYLEKVAYTPETSGEHEIKFVYNPVENDNFAIENEITSTVTVNLVHKLTLSDNIIGKAGDYRYGTAIDLSANIATENFAGWKITDAAGNEVDLGIDLTQKKITITMPDYDIHVEALEKGATGSDDSTGGIFEGFGDLTEGDSDNAIVNVFNNIIAWIKNIINTIIELFRSIGDNT